ncbi:MAG: hypothetical protein CW716_06470, partial [Candidatus Bathyarchaeum sp.]
MNKLPIKLLQCPGTNIARGRNIAVAHASHDVIAGTDGGCKLDKDWLNNITKPFLAQPETDVVSGAYLPWHTTVFEEVASCLIFPDVKRISVNFLPSSRSIAYKKSAWERVNGYPEWLETAEDTYFDLKCKDAGLRFALVRNAIVYWRVRRNLHGVAKQFYRYAEGDGLAFLFPRRYLPRCMAAMLFFLFSFFYSHLYFWLFLLSSVAAVTWFKHLQKVVHPSVKRLGIAFEVALAIEVGLFSGFISGILQHARNRIRRSRHN